MGISSSPGSGESSRSVSHRPGAAFPFFPSPYSPALIRGAALLLCLLLPAFGALAQDGGTVSGVVVSSWDGTPLAGATVSVRGTTLATQTDATGRFELKNVPAGDQVLRFSKSSYASVVVTDARVLPGQTTTVNGNLRPEFYEMDEYEVTAEEFTEQTGQIMFDRQNSSSMLDAIGSETISKLGSSNAGEVVNKVAGSAVVEGKYAVVRGLNDRYVPTTLNGAVVPSADPYRKSASLDQFPAQLVDQVAISKTFTPDLPGDFTGGGVDIITKAFPEAAFARFSLGTAYNTQSTFNENFLTYDGGGTDWLGMDDGTRELPGEVAPGTLVPSAEILTPVPTANPVGYASSVARANTLDAQTRSLGVAQFQPYGEGAPVDQALGLSFGDTFALGGVPLGFLGALNYKREYRFYEDGQQQRLLAGGGQKSSYDDTRSLTTVNWAAMAGVAARFFENHEIGLNFLYSQTAQDTARIQVGTQVSSPDDTTYQNKLQYLERNLTTFQLEGKSLIPAWNDFKLDYLFALTSTSQDEPDTRLFNYVQIGDQYLTGGNFLPDPQSPTRYWANLEEESTQGKVDLTQPVELWSGLEGLVKAGWNGQSTTRDFVERQFFYRGAAPWVGGNPNTYLTEDNLGYAPTTLANGRIRWNWQRYITPYDSSYDGSRSIQAGYLMTDFAVIEPVRLIGGVRLEATDIQIHSESFFESSITGLKINDSALEQTDLLPAVGLVYTIMPKMLLRLNYGETVARPSFRELAAYRSYDPNLDIELEGNPRLQMTAIQNYDVRWEMYFDGPDILSVSFFYKTLELPIEQAFISLDGSILSWQNRETADVMGVEFEARKSLGFLNESLSDFSLGGNFSWITSETELTDQEFAVKASVVPGAEQTRPLSEQSPYILNLDLSYTNPRLGTTVSVVYNQAGPRMVIASLTTEDVYEQPSPSLDFIISQQFTKRLSMRFTAKNLLDPVRDLTYGEDGGPVFSSYTLGRTFGLSLNYTF